MAYETLLNVTPAITNVASYTFSSATSGVSANILLNLTNTTLGSNLADDVSYLSIQTVNAPALGAALSATTPTSIYLTLSSASVIPSTIYYIGSLVSSTLNTANSSVTFAINFPVANDADNVNLQTTNLYLSGNSTTITFDTTKNSTLDNFFFVSTNPAETAANSSNAVRTVLGHSRLVALRG